MPPKRNDGGGDSPCTFWSQNVAAFAPRTLQSKLVPPTDCTPAHATPESASDREEADQCVGSHEWVPMTRETPRGLSGSTHRGHCQQPPCPRTVVAGPAPGAALSPGQCAVPPGAACVGTAALPLQGRGSAGAGRCRGGAAPGWCRGGAGAGCRGGAVQGRGGGRCRLGRHRWSRTGRARHCPRPCRPYSL